MRRRPLKLALEEVLNVDKLAQAEDLADKSSAYDGLYDRVQQEMKEKTDEDTQDPSEGTKDNPPDATTTDEQAPDEGDPDASTDPEPTDDVPAEEAFSLLHETSVKTLLDHRQLALEGELADRLVQVGKATAKAGGYLAEIGVEYGGILLKHVYKGIIKAVGLTSRALSVGLAKIKAYHKQRSESYATFKTRLKGLSEAVAGKEPKPSDTPLVFSDRQVIAKLKIGKSYDLIANLKPVTLMLTGVVPALQDKLVKATQGTLTLMERVGEEGLEVRANALYNDHSLPDMVVDTNMKREVVSAEASDGAKALTIERWKYVLPGDLSLLLYTPAPIRNVSVMKEAMSLSKLSIQLTTPDLEVSESIPYLSKEEIVKTLSALETLCDLGAKGGFFFDTAVKQRVLLQEGLKKYMDALVHSKDKISIQESMADVIAVKVAFIDHVYIGGSIKIHDVVVSIMQAYLTYIEASIENL